MKNHTPLYKHILMACSLGAAMFFSGRAASAACQLRPAKPAASFATDTLAQNSERNRIDARRNAFEQEEAALERKNLLDSLSKLPPEDPELFSNEKDEYLWFEKTRAQGDAYEKAIKDLKELIETQKLW